MSSTIRIEKVCEHCGKEFTARTTVTRFCSHKCNSRAYKSGIRKGKVENIAVEMEIMKATKQNVLNEKPFLTVIETCQLLGIGKTNFYSLVHDGVLTPVKLGSRTIIARKQIDSLFK